METYEGMPIFLVMGSTGEYDDHHEWIVCAYRDVESAQTHAKLAEEDAAKRYTGRLGHAPIFERHDSPFDACMQIDYTGTSYYVEEAILHNKCRL